MPIPFKVENHPEGMNQIDLFLLEEEREIAKRLIAEGIKFTVRFAPRKNLILCASDPKLGPIALLICPNTEDGLHQALHQLMRAAGKVFDDAIECN